MSEAGRDNFVVCTKCNRCLPCPAKINIPAMMEVVRLLKNLNDFPKAFELYNELVCDDNDQTSSLPSLCYQCGSCELRCPERVKVIAGLKDIVMVFEKNEDKEKGQ